MQNHFELFQLPQRFDVDLNALNGAFHEIQGRVHPDKFAHATDAEKRVAMQWATRANEAYQTLKSPLKRASYLCELHGVELESESNTAMPAGFLMQQMEWREALDDARGAKDIDALEALDADLRELRADELRRIAASLDADDYAGAASAIRKLMFVEKFGEDVGRVFDAISE
jgi:molecular chaperone HscB